MSECSTCGGKGFYYWPAGCGDPDCCGTGMEKVKCEDCENDWKPEESDD